VANDNRAALSAVELKAPDRLNDRALDIWEPLLAIAEHVGGDWPKLAADASIALSGGEAASEERSIELLADIKVAFEASGRDEVTTKALVAALCADEERPWATYNKGKPISDRQVAKLLKEIPILSEDVYPPGERHAKGYKKVRFLDAFERYLAPSNHASPEIAGTQACERVNADEMGTSRGFSIRVECDLHGSEKCEKPASHADLHAYTDKNPENPREGNGSNAAGEFRSDIEDAPDGDHLTIPQCLDRRHEVCAECGQPGGTYFGLKVRLHERCERPWIDAHEASRNGPMACMGACS
jgi:hypothetical protein